MYGATDTNNTEQLKGSNHSHHRHDVQFYSQDKFLLEGLSEYIGKALRSGDGAVVVATEQHRNGLLQWLTAQGLDVTSFIERGQFITLDARQLLTSFMGPAQHWPDEKRFQEVVGEVISRARSCAPGSESRVAIFGEMVALLWADGKPEAAIRLEQLWNGLAHTHCFSLLCAYPMSSFSRKEDAELLVRICDEHSAALPTEGFMGLPGENERFRSIVQLQQKAKALETEVAEHRRLRQELESRVQARTAELQSKNVQLQEEIRRRKDAEAGLRTLTSQLMLIRDEERRRVAHELHESTAQVLASVAMNLSALAGTSSSLTPRNAGLIAESSRLVDELLSEVRQLSHLLHPPTLDEIGLPSAIQWYVERFSRRSNILVTFDIPTRFGRLSRDKEIAIFRVVQEALANVQQHSGSPTATVRLSQSDVRVSVEVSDRGKGMPVQPTHVRSGVGIYGMRERLRQLGGGLNVHSDGNGTVVTADLPV